MIPKNQPVIVEKEPSFFFDIQPGMLVRNALITTEPLPVDESIFTDHQIVLIEKFINREIEKKNQEIEVLLKEKNREINERDKKIDNLIEDYEQLIIDAKKEEKKHFETEKKVVWQNGYQAGITQTQNQMLSSVTTVTEQLTNFIETFKLQTEQVLEYHEQEMMQLIVKIARKVIDVELMLNEDIILNTLKNCLNSMTEKEEFKIQVHPQDWANVQENLKKLALSIHIPEKVEIISNAKIFPGGCRVEFKAGSIDAEIDTQFNEIQKKLLIK